MGLPEEDKGPAWLRDYGRASGYTKASSFTGYDEGKLAVELGDLKLFADVLEKEHMLDYRPHAQVVFEQMATVTQSPDKRFQELCAGMQGHRDMLVQAADALARHDEAVLNLVKATREIIKQYGKTDALTATRTSDVNRVLAADPNAAPPGQNGQPATQPGTGQPAGTPGASTIPAVNPTDGATTSDNGGDYR
ncbi:hypothetical protein Cs7R123_76290 [Catellatospora sp. TT07R-123]|uniref:hypothetical protein n=1 Tax=Catellatospora sp. TT07R-123 TaxID=2733863 RepID=UPI001B101364|nr:hypothetical protein [Catellatospora sp. TT07R-123]GHJ50287.1 hypothetical protein Cs7R123_76290 [Catellatospora sp. TT07R-123]